VADLDLEPRNPIVGSRAWGADPAEAAPLVAAWVRGCREGGALSCVKHFPGHGRTLGDSHLALPRVTADREMLVATDLVPFAAAVGAGVDSVMIGHVAYPALDPVERPATLSPPILGELLRSRLGFRGISVTDAIDMVGFAKAGEAGERAVDAVAAGCDVLLGPANPQGVADALRRAVQEGSLSAHRLAEAVQRMDSVMRSLPSPAGGGWGREEDLEWAREVALRAVAVARGSPRLLGSRVNLIQVDDDVGGRHAPPPRAAFPHTLTSSGLEIQPDGGPLLAVYADVRGWKGHAGLSDEARRRVERVCAEHPEITTVLFGHPRIVSEVPTARHVLVAWGGEPLMQRAAGVWLTRQR
jgi:beta-glucosidase-like glycosyl hydrolase